MCVCVSIFCMYVYYSGIELQNSRRMTPLSESERVCVRTHACVCVCLRLRAAAVSVSFCALCASLQALRLLYLNARALRTHTLHTHTAHANLNIAGPDRSSEIIGACGFR